MANHEQDGIGDEDELFSEMLSGDAPKFDAEPDDKGTDEPAALEPVAEKATRERDEFGRFKARSQDTQEQPAEAEPQTQVEAPVEAAAQEPEAAQPPAKEDREGWVPAYRVRETREERDAERARAETLARELDAERRQREADRRTYEQYLQRMQAQPQQQPQQPQSPPDMFEDPVAYNAYRERQFAELQQQMREQIQKEARSIRLQMNLAHHGHVHGNEFHDAVEAFTSAAEEEQGLGVDTLQRFIFGPPTNPHPDPGDRILRWHRSNEIMKKTGGDLSAYEQQIEERLLNDQAHLAKAIERARAQAGGQPVVSTTTAQPAARPNTVTQLPPSLRSVPGAAASSQSTGVETLNDAELFDSIVRR